MFQSYWITSAQGNDPLEPLKMEPPPTLRFPRYAVVWDVEPPIVWGKPELQTIRI